MKNYFAALSTTALISVAPHALAASSTDLTVTGTIIPSACTPSLSNGGTIDIGEIQVKNLNLTTPTQVSNETLQLTVSCEAPAVFGLKAIDNNPGTSSNWAWFGIGRTDAGEKLGYMLSFASNTVADGQPARALQSTDNGSTWFAHHHYRPNWFMSVASTTDLTTPIAVQDLSIDLTIMTHIERADSLTLADDTAINGSVTYELRYL